MDNTTLFELLIKNFLNSFLIFVFSVLMIEGGLFFLRIKNPRMRALSRCIPILKLPLDLFIYQLISWNGLWHFYLFGCEGFIKKFLIYLLPDYFPLNMDSNNFPTVSNAIFVNLPNYWLTIFFICILTISCILVIRKVYLIYRSIKYIERLSRSSELCLRQISNAKLFAKLTRTGVHIFQSAETNIPFAATHSIIFLPKKITDTFSQKEFEAVIAHELEHIKWQDPWIRLTCEIIRSLFWWIPTAWLLRKIEEEQEQASDACLESYHMDKEALMTSIYKVAKHIKSSEDDFKDKYALCGFFTKSSPLLKRFQKILDEECNTMQSCFTTNFSIAILSLAMISMRFCIC